MKKAILLVLIIGVLLTGCEFEVIGKHTAIMRDGELTYRIETDSRLFYVTREVYEKISTGDIIDF